MSLKIEDTKLRLIDLKKMVLTAIIRQPIFVIIE